MIMLCEGGEGWTSDLVSSFFKKKEGHHLCILSKPACDSSVPLHLCQGKLRSNATSQFSLPP